MEAIERLRTSFQKNATRTANGRVVLTSMIFMGFVISGIVEHGITVALSPYKFSLDVPNPENGTEKSRPRRYCDPPNMTALAIYYDSSEETNFDDNYDIAQLQEMFFQTSLSPNEKMELLLKKFYLWGTLFSPLPASQLAANIGPKRVFGYSLLGAAAATLLVPAAWLTIAHVVLRFFQGLFCGALIPSAHALAINWFPPYRRSSFVSWYSGKYVGYALCELLTVQVLKTAGPGSIYYITSILTIIWFVPWSMIVFNTPDKHLKYSAGEKRNVTGVQPATLNFPLKYMLCSRPVWMSIGVIFGAYCGQIGINVAMRMYLEYVYNVTGGLLSAIPFLLHFVFAVCCGYLVDVIQEIQFVSVTSSRRMFVYVSHFIPAGFLFVIGFVGCDTTAPVILYSLAIIISGATYAGAFCSPLDTAPNFAGTIVAFCCTFGAGGSILMFYLISHVLDGKVLGSWRITFSLTSLILLVSSIFFMLRGSGAIQPWNDPLTMADVEAEASKKEKQIMGESIQSKQKRKSIYTIEKKILKVLHVQEPEKFTRARAYSTSFQTDRRLESPLNIYKLSNQKRASIS